MTKKQVKKTKDTAGSGAGQPASPIDRRLLDEHIEMLRPALQAHGGNIELLSVKPDGEVVVKLTGACAGCAMAQLTLKEGVEKFLVKRVPGVTAVTAEGISA